MSDDLFVELFEEGEEPDKPVRYYPGSKTPIYDTDSKPEVPERSVPDSFDLSDYDVGRTVTKTVQGKEVTLYTIQALASVLGKSVVSIRLWEGKGFIPPAPFRTKALAPSRGSGSPQNYESGRRYYSEQVLRATWEEFASRDLLAQRRVEWRMHKDLPEALRRRWNAIVFEFQQGNN